MNVPNKKLLKILIKKLLKLKKQVQTPKYFIKHLKE